MKLSYNRQLGKYVISQLGTIIDSSDNLDVLLTRNGLMEESQVLPFDKVEGDNYDADLDRLLGDFLEVN